jgi:hypothetical protein
MVGEYDLMLPEDRDRKLEDLENKHREWLEVRSQGKVRFVLLDGLLRSALFNLVWAAFAIISFHVKAGLAVLIAVLILFSSRVFSLLEWHWKDRRYLGQVQGAEDSQKSR